MKFEEALHQFWNSFGVNAYDENTVPEDAPYPRITYEVVFGNFDSDSISSVDIWDYGRFWDGVTDIKDLIMERIGEDCGGGDIRYDGGKITLYAEQWRRTPDDNPEIRHITINIISNH